MTRGSVTSSCSTTGEGIATCFVEPVSFVLNVTPRRSCGPSLYGLETPGPPKTCAHRVCDQMLNLWLLLMFGSG